VLRHQLIVLLRRVTGEFSSAYQQRRWFLVQVYRSFLSILNVVEPETQSLTDDARASREHTVAESCIPIVADKPSRLLMHLRINETIAYEVGPDSLQCQLCGNARGQPDRSVLGSGTRSRLEGREIDPTLTTEPPRPPASMTPCFMLRKAPLRLMSRTRSHSSSGRSVIPENRPLDAALFGAV
jgi:hypothetical protein